MEYNVHGKKEQRGSLAEFDMLGIINARVVSKGRQGRTREIKLMLSPSIKEKAKEILKKSLDL